MMRLPLICLTTLVSQAFQALLLVWSLPTLTAAAEPKWPRSVDEYARLLHETRSKRTSVEPAYKKGMQAINDLGDLLSRDESEIDRKWLKELRAKMEGFELTPNTETILANPDSAFFIALAKKNGVASDQSFYELDKQTSPDGRWPAYIQQRTDYSGCTVFDGTLTRLYRSWTAFRSQYPKAFTVEARGRLEEIERNLTESRCFCSEKKDPVLTELQSFLKEFPKAAVSRKIETRIEEIRTGRIAVPGCEGIG